MISGMASVANLIYLIFLSVAANGLGLADYVCASLETVTHLLQTLPHKVGPPTVLEKGLL